VKVRTKEKRKRRRRSRRREDVSGERGFCVGAKSAEGVARASFARTLDALSSGSRLAGGTTASLRTEVWRGARLEAPRPPEKTLFRSSASAIVSR
jgi:hypothetical protein